MLKDGIPKNKLESALNSIILNKDALTALVDIFPMIVDIDGSVFGVRSEDEWNMLINKIKEKLNS